MSRVQVVPELMRRLPEFKAAVDQHLADNFGELLLHPLFGDLSRFVLAAHERGDSDLVLRSLGFLEDAFRNGDEYVENLVTVSFVENIGPSNEEQAAFIDTWPLRLRTEAHRQRDGGPDQG